MYNEHYKILVSALTFKPARAYRGPYNIPATF
jgi:hypothetical protein